MYVLSGVHYWKSGNMVKGGIKYLVLNSYIILMSIVMLPLKPVIKFAKILQ